MELMRWIEIITTGLSGARSGQEIRIPRATFFELQILKRRPPVLPAGNN